jgi:CheY-like chemotaxis protein
LIVDDDPDTREMYVMGLSFAGLDATAVGNADEAYRRAWETHPDVIVTDLCLPRSDGWTLIRCLQRDPSTEHNPLVVLTGHAELSSRRRAAREGCAAFVVKPCLPEELATELRRLLHH